MSQDTNDAARKGENGSTNNGEGDDYILDFNFNIANMFKFG